MYKLKVGAFWEEFKAWETLKSVRILCATWVRKWKSLLDCKKVDELGDVIRESNDIWTTICQQLLWQPHFSLFSLVKNNGERKRKRGRVRI
jgi:hypothetical protein